MKVEFYSVFGAAEFSSAFLGESVTTIADASSALDAWTLHELNLVAPNNAVEARLSLLFNDQSGMAGTAYLDDAKFEVLAHLSGRLQRRRRRQRRGLCRLAQRPRHHLHAI